MIRLIISAGIKLLANALGLITAAVVLDDVTITGAALVTTFLGLVITATVSDGLSISGTTTWVLATLIVWLAVLAAALVLPLLFVKKAVNNRR